MENREATLAERTVASYSSRLSSSRLVQSAGRSRRDVTAGARKWRHIDWLTPLRGLLLVNVALGAAMSVTYNAQYNAPDLITSERMNVTWVVYGTSYDKSIKGFIRRLRANSDHIDNWYNWRLSKKFTAMISVLSFFCPGEIKRC